MTPSVTLCRQQHNAVQRAIPWTVSKLIVGEDGPERWGSLHNWEEVLKGVDLVFSTFAVLYGALCHGYVRMDQMSLLIFDEGKASTWSTCGSPAHET